ncbi:MAG TPA: DinB family protein [Mucilaginibacter sp.]
MELLAQQYEYVKGARHALFAYCQAMDNADLFKKVAAFNGSTISELLLHIANAYISWLENFGLGGTLSFYENGNVKDLEEIRILYEQVDLFVLEFLKKYSDDYRRSLTREIKRKGITLTLTPLQLFTHVITHEFHHKGQILTMSRTLGYIPVDTDVIRT